MKKPMPKKVKIVLKVSLLVVCLIVGYGIGMLHMWRMAHVNTYARNALKNYYWKAEHPLTGPYYETHNN